MAFRIIIISIFIMSNGVGLSSEIRFTFKKENDSYKDEYVKSSATLDKLLAVRKEKQDLKDDLLKQLQSVNVIISNLDEKIQTRSNYNVQLNNIMKFKKNLIGSIIYFNFI